MAESYLKDLKKQLPCAVYLNSEYGAKEIYAGVPVIIGKNGVEKIIELELSSEEKANFENSVKSVRDLLDAAKKLTTNLNKKNSIIQKNFFYLLILIIISFSFTCYSGYRGVYPIDSFIIFDSGYKVLNNIHPFKDYWSITGPLLDYLQSIFFNRYKLVYLRFACCFYEYLSNWDIFLFFSKIRVKY